MKIIKILFLSVFVSGLAIADEEPADPAIQTQRSTEADPGTAPAPAPIPESTVTEPESAPAPEPEKVEKKEKKTKKINKTRKVKTACDILDSPDGKKVGTLKVGVPIWTDEHVEGWAKVYRKSGIGYAKTDCFE